MHLYGTVHLPPPVYIPLRPRLTELTRNIANFKFLLPQSINDSTKFPIVFYRFTANSVDQISTWAVRLRKRMSKNMIFVMR